MQAKIKIEKIVFGGKGLGRIDNKVVLTDSVLPQEIVEVELIEQKGYFEGKLLSVLESSKERIEPDCPYASICGGCDFRHTVYLYEVQLKIEMLKDALRQIGKIDLHSSDIEVISSPCRDGYRIKSKFQYKRGKFGFYKKKSKKIVAVKECLNLPSHINAVLPEIKTSTQFFLESHLFRNKYYRYKKTSNLKPVKYLFEDYIFVHKPGNFIQANRFLLSSFIDKVKEYAGREGVLVELFAGSGFFTLPLSFHFDKVICYEISKNAISCLRKSINLNCIKNIIANISNCENINLKNVDTIVLDPPREGCFKSLIDNINSSNAKNIVYVSCNASTFARDLNRLTNYTLSDITLIDMFPGTAHFEIVAKFLKNSIV
jgi:23S rRNA (uracil1939-C5)-methyltransferase